MNWEKWYIEKGNWTIYWSGKTPGLELIYSIKKHRFNARRPYFRAEDLNKTWSSAIERIKLQTP